MRGSGSSENPENPGNPEKIREKNRESGKNWKHLERNPKKTGKIRATLEKSGSPALLKNVLAHSVSNCLKSTMSTGSEPPRNSGKTQPSANLAGSIAHGSQILGSTCTVHVMHGFTLVYIYIYIIVGGIWDHPPYSHLGLPWDLSGTLLGPPDPPWDFPGPPLGPPDSPK